MKDLRSRFFQGVKASYSEWLEEKIIRANQSFDLKEATDKVNTAKKQEIMSLFTKYLGIFYSFPNHQENLYPLPSSCQWEERFKLYGACWVADFDGL